MKRPGNTPPFCGPRGASSAVIRPVFAALNAAIVTTVAANRGYKSPQDMRWNGRPQKAIADEVGQGLHVTEQDAPGLSRITGRSGAWQMRGRSRISGISR